MKIARVKENAFTMVELMVSMGLLSLVIAAVLACNLTGLKIAQVSQAQITASAESHFMLDKLMKELRGAYGLEVGTNTGGVFSAVPDEKVQAGTALRVYLTTNSANWICYYYVPSSNAIYRAEDDVAARQVVSSVTNSVPIFALEDFVGRPITNTVPTVPVLVSVNLKFSSMLKSLGTNLLSTNYYSVRTKLTPRRT